MWLLCQQTTGFRHFLKDLGLQKTEGEFMERVVLTPSQLFLPPSGAGGGTAPGAATASGTPGRLEGWESSRREARLLAGAVRGGRGRPSFSSC